MHRQVIRTEDKSRLVRAYRNLEDYLALADQLGIKRASARSIVSRAMKNDDPEHIEEKKRGGRHHVKVTEEMREVIADLIGRNPAITLKSLNSQLRERLPDSPHVHENYLGTVCKGMFYSLKKLEPQPVDRNRPDVKEERKRYANWFIENVVVSPLTIYIDESGYNVWTSRTRGRAIIGQPAVRTVHGQRGENITLILAISPQRGIEHHSFHIGGTSAATFQIFFKALSEKVGLNNSCTFILDNAPCHRSTEALSPNHTVKFLPPYSPMLTPIENSFSTWKWALKNKLSEPTAQARFANVTEAATNNMNLAQWRRHLLITFGEESLIVITPPKCLAWYNHAMTYLAKCMSLENM